MKKRVITALCMMIVLVPLILIDNIITEYLFLGVVMFVCVVGTYELMNVMYQKSPVLKIYRILIPIFSGIIAFLTVFATRLSSDSLEPENFLLGHIIVFCTYISFVAIILGMMIFTKNSSASDIMSCILGLTYSGLMLGYAFSIRYLTPNYINNDIINIQNWKSFAYVYTIVVITDTFAYIFGVRFGKHKLCPNISPKKSVEGAIAGLVFGTVIGTLCLFIYKIVNPISTEVILKTILIGGALSCFLSIFVQLGDLIESKLKRTYEIKDFGNILPGHGGILDRFDSLIYSGVWYYLIVIIVSIINIVIIN